ncbi:MAG: DUF1214 domain-containing protein [Bauldia sp.]|nr:MAG: DUF1214 domain-containing protein [Bauldia sp.]MBZ0228313.1 DUF1214 domain-containing protein [Bauldia sp.]
MRFLIDIAIAVVVATVIGFVTAWYAVDRGNLFGAVALGDWKAWPATGSPDADPYSVAMLARTGEVPLGTGEGIAFTAETDHAGEPLSSRCAYRIVGQTPAARLWTLTAYDAEGRLMANAARRAAFHSREVLRRGDGSFEITVSVDVAPGNWLPLARVDKFKLVLRFYDTPLTTGSQLADSTMPAIIREVCP